MLTTDQINSNDASRLMLTRSGMEILSGSSSVRHLVRAMLIAARYDINIIANWNSYSTKTLTMLVYMLEDEMVKPKEGETPPTPTYFRELHDSGNLTFFKPETHVMDVIRLGLMGARRDMVGMPILTMMLDKYSSRLDTPTRESLKTFIMWHIQNRNFDPEFVVDILANVKEVNVLRSITAMMKSSKHDKYYQDFILRMGDCEAFGAACLNVSQRLSGTPS